jgi:hypothetical protein
MGECIFKSNNKLLTLSKIICLFIVIFYCNCSGKIEKKILLDTLNSKKYILYDKLCLEKKIINYKINDFLVLYNNTKYGLSKNNYEVSSTYSKGFDFINNKKLNFVNTPLSNQFISYKNEGIHYIHFPIRVFDREQVVRIMSKKAGNYLCMGYQEYPSYDAYHQGFSLVHDIGYCFFYDIKNNIFLFLSQDSGQGKLKSVEKITSFIILDSSLYPLIKIIFENKKAKYLHRLVYSKEVLKNELSYKISKNFELNNETTIADILGLLCEKHERVGYITPLLGKGYKKLPSWLSANGNYAYED